MTTQPELDLAFGLPALVPKVDSIPQYSKRGNAKLELSKQLENPDALCDITSISVQSGFRNNSKFYRRASTHLRVFITHRDKNKNGILAQYASRYQDSIDDRMGEYKKHFSAVIKHLQANGLLLNKVTQEQLENPKGFRWSQKAGCRCGCSPAFICPSWLTLKDKWNDIYAEVKEKEHAEVDIKVSPARMEIITNNVSDYLAPEIKAEIAQYKQAK